MRTGGTGVLAQVIVLLLLLPSLPADAAAPYVGRTLIEVIDDLRGQGLRIVYSSALVSPDMLVGSEPAAREPRAVLDEILQPHGLAAKEEVPGLIVIVEVIPTESTRATGSIRGVVLSDAEPALLAGITITVVGTDLAARVDGNGVFSISGVPAGVHTLQARSTAFLPRSVPDIRVEAGRVSEVRIPLHLAVFLSDIVVTPSHFRILDQQLESRQFLSRDEVAQMPHAADDLYRAVKRLPGAAGGDYSALFNVRGGVQDEVLVMLDGLELYEPFHLKDFQSIFSTVDAEAVGGVDFITGGFPVEYGDRMSGVMDISIATPDGPPVTSVGISTMNARLLSEGSFHQGRGHWLVTTRAWYPARFYDMVGTISDEILSDYYDLLAKLQHRIGRRSILSGNLLLAYDDLAYGNRDGEEWERVTARYNSNHVWLNLQTDWSDALYSRTVLATGHISRRRTGAVFEEEGTLDIDDDRRFDLVELKQDWSLELADRHLLKWGADLKRQEATYHYTHAQVLIDPEAETGETRQWRIDLRPDGTSYSVYLADRLRLSDSLVAELGLRWDKQSWIDDPQLSPRLNLRYNAGLRTTLRAAWGRFYQSQRLNELQVEDGVTEHHPAQLAEHWLASVEHRFADGLALRIEGYRKDLSRLQPRYENLFNPIELFPEAATDRILVAPERGRARGVELLLKRSGHGPISWWLSYAVASVEDRIDGRMVPRSWDQRHAASFGLNLDLDRGWNLNLAGTFHSGWPTTVVTAELVEDEEGELQPEPIYGPRNGGRYSDYLRLDLRLSKRWLTRFGELRLIFEAINLTSRDNACCVDDFAYLVQEDGSVVVKPELRSWAPIVPSLGIRWQPGNR